MMIRKLRLLPFWLSFAAASLILLPAVPGRAQNAPATPAPAAPASAKPVPSAPAQAAPAPAAPAAAAPAKAADEETPAQPPDRAKAYYHLALADTYEEDAVALGRPEYVNRAIEEYKAALNADPGSPLLNNGLADLYFRVGRLRDAELTARELLRKSPGDLDAHKLLGKIYLRQLGEGQNSVLGTSAGNVLDLAIAEFEKIVSLQPKSVEDRMVLGQLYTVKHHRAQGGRAVQDRAGHGAGFGRSGAQPGPPLRRKRRHRTCGQGHRGRSGGRSQRQNGVFPGRGL